MDPKKKQLTDASSTNIDGSFFSVAMTTPFEAARTKYLVTNNKSWSQSTINSTFENLIRIKWNKNINVKNDR